MLYEEDDHRHPPWVQKLRREARAALTEENRRLAHFEERQRSWRFADPYDPATFFPEQHEDLTEMKLHRLGELPEYQSPEPDLPIGLAPETVSRAVEDALDRAAIPTGRTYQQLRAEARTRAGWSLPPDEDEPGAKPRRATIERQAMIYSLFHDPFEVALLADITPLDILQTVARRLLANGHLSLAAGIAATAAPYCHPRADLARKPDAPAIDHDPAAARDA